MAFIPRPGDPAEHLTAYLSYDSPTGQYELRPESNRALPENCERLSAFCQQRLEVSVEVSLLQRLGVQSGFKILEAFTQLRPERFEVHVFQRGMHAVKFFI